MLGMIEAGKIDCHQTRKPQRGTVRGVPIEGLECVHGLPERIFVHGGTSIFCITEQGIEVCVNRPSPTSTREHMVHNNALPSMLPDILIQRAQLTVHIVREEVLL